MSRPSEVGEGRLRRRGSGEGGMPTSVALRVAAGTLWWWVMLLLLL